MFYLVLTILNCSDLSCALQWKSVFIRASGHDTCPLLLPCNGKFLLPYPSRGKSFYYLWWWNTGSLIIHPCGKSVYTGQPCPVTSVYVPAGYIRYPAKSLKIIPLFFKTITSQSDYIRILAGILTYNTPVIRNICNNCVF